MIKLSDFKPGDKVYKLTREKVFYTSGSGKANREYDRIEEMYVVNVGRKYVSIGASPDSVPVEKYVMPHGQPYNYLDHSNNSRYSVYGRLFRSMEDHRDYQDYYAFLKKIRDIPVSSLSLEQLRKIAEICGIA